MVVGIALILNSKGIGVSSRLEHLHDTFAIDFIGFPIFIESGKFGMGRPGVGRNLPQVLHLIISRIPIQKVRQNTTIFAINSLHDTNNVVGRHRDTTMIFHHHTNTGCLTNCRQFLKTFDKYLDKITSLFFNYLLLVILRSAAKPVPSLRSRTSSKLAAGKNLMP